MDNRLAVDLGLAGHLFDTLRALSEDPPGVTRAAYGPAEQAAHDLMSATARDLGLDVAVDPAGTLLLTLQGRDPQAAAWVIGSHLDSVPHGGNFDGAAGVIAGVLVAAAFRRAGVVPPRPVVIAAFRAEESNWFPISYLGSKAALGLLPADALQTPRSDTGLSLADHMRDLGLRPDLVATGAAILKPEAIHAFLEVHIEQGPVLESAGIPVALVTGISGSFRYRGARCLGEWAHSGAVPRDHRRDAVVALAELIGMLDGRWAAWHAAGDPTTVTFGQVETDRSQHAFSKVAGEVAFALDVRSPSSERLAALHEEVLALVADIERRRGVRFDLGPRTGSTPAVLDAGLRASLMETADDLGIATIAMPSGAGHDTATFAHAGVPSALLFVRNQNGSHNPEEAMALEDLGRAAEILAHRLMRQD